MSWQLHREVVARPGRSDLYLTSVARSPVADDDAALAEPLEALAAALEGAVVLQAKIYGVAAHRERIVASLRRALEARRLDGEVPLTFIEGAPWIGGVYAGAQIIAVRVEDGGARVTTLRHEGRVIGRELDAAGLRHVFLSGVSGLEAGAESGVADQAERMLRRGAALLDANGSSAQRIARTWIYMPRILHWYGEFNRVRTSTFRALGILDEHGRGRLPASTGIQGLREPGEECYMDLLAVEGEAGHEPVAVPMRNVRQGEATDYGSSFARGMAVVEDPPTLYLSGTASIDPRGRTTYHADEQGQIVETLLNVAALLGTQGASLGDIRQATAFCKDESTYRAFERIVALLGLSGIPFLPVRADVCRDELLFEIDSLAVARKAEAEAEAEAKG